MSEALLSEIRAATISVANLEQSIAFYGDALGYRTTERGCVPAALARLWGHTGLNEVHYAMLAADDSGLGRLRLIAVGDPVPGLEPQTQRLWQDVSPRLGVGFFALNFRALDVQTALPRIVAAGGRARHKPTFWEVSEAVAVWDSISADPDDVQLDLFSYVRGGELRGALLTDVSVLQTVALATREIDRSVAFYQSLGYQVLFDRTLDFPELADLLGVHDGSPVRIRNVNLMQQGRIVPGRIEMFQHLHPANADEINLSARAVPGVSGIVSISFECQRLEPACALMRTQNAEVLGEFSGDVPGFGAATVICYLGPDRERIELIQRRT
jgi:catechol 2,3-dioxygenase-like lactoylglutathione lyase family enzyme